MFDHIGLRVKDLEKAKKLYAAMLAPLGSVLGPSGEGYAGFGPKDKPKLWLHLDKKGSVAAISASPAGRLAAIPSRSATCSPMCRNGLDSPPAGNQSRASAPSCSMAKATTSRRSASSDDVPQRRAGAKLME